jgi:hypothetical protein
MKRFMFLFLVGLHLSLCNCVSGQDVWQGATTDQQRCESEARYMVARNIRGHVGPVIGRFEGVGFGGYNCSTCTPRRGMALTGDARAQYPDGSWCRVRSWR